MIRVDVYINDRKIAVAGAVNKSDLADTSDYEVFAVSEASPVTGRARTEHNFRISGHDRNQSAWSLIAKIARQIAEDESK